MINTKFYKSLIQKALDENNDEALKMWTQYLVQLGYEWELAWNFKSLKLEVKLIKIA